MPSVCGQVNVGVDNCKNVCIKQSAACNTPQPGNYTLNCPNGASFNIIAGQNVNVNQLCQIQQQSQIATGGQGGAGGAGGSTGPIIITVPAAPAAAQPILIGTGNVGVGVSYVSGVQFTALPKTGLPALAWSALAFIPAGYSMRRFSKTKKDLENHPSYIFEDRQFKS